MTAGSAPFSDADLEQIRSHGLAPEEALRQLELLSQPPPPARLVRPCTVGDGVLRLEASDRSRLEDVYRSGQSAGRFGKFVPASGAASRMFRSLLTFLDNPAAAGEGGRLAAQRFAADFDRFAFADEVPLENRPAAAREPDDEELQRLLETTLTATGLGLAQRPKALVPFHRDPRTDEPLSALAEHLFEATEHLLDSDGRAAVHFTIPQHRELDFRDAIRPLEARLENERGAQLEISWSIQRPETDTLALDSDGLPARDGHGRLLFRPGGHGALLHNLAALDSDLVFLRNIDNVQPHHRRPAVVHWNRVLGGLLMEIDADIERTLDLLARDALDGEALRREASAFAERFGVAPLHPAADGTDDALRQALVERLDRPLRVVGVVPNAGEPGGGPYWVADDTGQASPQIVESAQIDRDDPTQRAALDAATHFNPVHLVARARSRSGRGPDLAGSVDPSTAFVAEKSHGGRPLRVLEHPGLWNGAMARWNTVFVELPAEVFAPVKTVFDLLRPEHQPQAAAEVPAGR